MTMIHALPDSYANFASSLQLLDKLDKDTLQAAFVNEEALRTRTSTPGSTAVLSATASNAVCDFCALPGHPQAQCIRYTRMKLQATKDATEKMMQRDKKPSKSSTTAGAAQEVATESASQATVRSSEASTTPCSIWESNSTSSTL